MGEKVEAKAGEKLPVYGTGNNIRDWLFVKDHCIAIDTVLHKGVKGEVYNVGGNNEKTNLEIVKTILKQLGKPEDLITFVEDRKGHDYKYAINSSKIKDNNFFIFDLLNNKLTSRAIIKSP